MADLLGLHRAVLDANARRPGYLSGHDNPDGEGGNGSSSCTARGTRCCCRTRGTSARRSCSPRSGFQALATTSSGFAATLGRLDGSVSRDEALAHAAAIVAATDLPVSADLENGFADDPDGVAETVSPGGRDRAGGLARWRTSAAVTASPIYDIGLAAERVAAAAEAAHAGPARLVLTARAENYLHGRPDLADTIARLQAYQEAGADVLYAPGLTSLADIGQVVAAVDRPVNVLALPGVPPVAELAEAGVSRVSVGGAFAFAALGAVADAATSCATTAPTATWRAARPACRLIQRAF